jgi:hypothetical protein
MAFGSIPFQPISSMTQASGWCISKRGGDCKGNPFPPNPNTSNLFTWPAAACPLTQLATVHLLTSGKHLVHLWVSLASSQRHQRVERCKRHKRCDIFGKLGT